MDQPLGHIEAITEDDRGLRVIGKIENVASRAASLLKSGGVTGLSFGYRARQARPTDAGRELLVLDLFEVSLVTHPLQHGARVHLVA